MKERFLGLAKYYVVLTIAFLPVLILTRIYELIKLTSQHTLPSSSWLSLLAGAGVDILLFFSLAIVFAIPFLALSLINRKIGSYFYLGILILVSVVNFLLVSYFIMTLVPLDQVIFAYTFEEIIKIVLGSTRFDLIGLVAFMVLMIWPWLFLWLTRRWQPGKISLYTFTGLWIVSVGILPLVLPSRDAFEKDFHYYLTENKLYYALKKCSRYLIKNLGEDISDVIDSHSAAVQMDPEMQRTSVYFQQASPAFAYYTPDFPFLRKDQTPNVLGEYIELMEEKPNLVFIIVESLTPSFCGSHPWFGSYMPFLDSLIGESLYWENCLSTSERTFGVLPAIFGSLPYANGAFLNDAREKPSHYSLIKYLKKAGYFARFFYGGDPKFTNYDSFLSQEGVDYILGFFDEKYKKNVLFDEWFRWGYPDGDLFERALTVFDSMQRSPRLDIILTLSMHAPFT
ncbi:MAG: sulfatase-like hydrolase/transferase, partial [Bacteroidia bacterium]|nr:sulfatase-like hydrolase/transferase [Bacteroidia bacterium]